MRRGRAPGVDVLSQERDLFHARRGERPHFGDDRLHGARNLRTPRIGHDAERAELVASFLHGHEGGRSLRLFLSPRCVFLRAFEGAFSRFQARFGEHVELFLDREVRLQNIAARAGGFGEKLRQAVIGLRPHDHVDHGRARFHLGALGLGDAAGDRNRHVPAFGAAGGLQFLQSAEFGVNFLRGLLPDVAGIEDDKVRVVGRLGPRVAQRRQEIDHAFAVIDVHLTAISLDEEGLAALFFRAFLVYA